MSIVLQAHDQAIDPNLVKLAEAFKIASQKVGKNALQSIDAAEDTELLADLFGGLRIATAACQ